MKKETAKRELDKELIYNRVFETPIVGMTILDMDQNIVFGNVTARKIFELERDPVGVDVREFLNEESKNLVDTVILPALEKTGSWQGDLVGKLKDGREVPLSASCVVIHDEEGKPHAILATYRDVTERTQMEQALRESEKRYHKLVDTAPDVIYTLLWDGTLASLNPAFEKITGWSRNEWLNKHFAELVHPDDLAKAVETFQQTMRDETPPPYELRIRAKSGDYLVGEFTSKPLVEKGKVIGGLGIARDITKRKRAEEALRESEERYRSLVETSPDAVTMTDLEGRVIYVSPQTLELHGFKSAEELIGRSAFDLIAPEDHERAMINLQRTLKEGVAKNLEYTLLKKNGNRFIGSLNTALIKDANGKPKAFIATTMDITERKTAEDKLEEYSEKLEEKVKEKTKELLESHKKLVITERLAAIGEVATQVGHDLRNPLTSIKGAAYYLKMDKNIKLDENAKKMLDTIDASIAYSDKIITDLLDFSQKIKLKLARKTVRNIVTDAISSITVPKKVNVINSTESEPTIRADPLLIKRALHNVFTNAFDAMPDGGTLKIESKKNGENVSIRICDSGVGIPKNIIEKLFTPFFTTKAKGVGLGLAICKRIVEAHGGSISVESKEGKGTCVTIILPKNKR